MWIVGCLAIIYCIINVVYTLNWSPVYPGITWKNWNSLGVMIVGIIIYAMQYLIASFIYKKWKLPRIQNQSEYKKTNYYF